MNASDHTHKTEDAKMPAFENNVVALIIIAPIHSI